MVHAPFPPALSSTEYRRSSGKRYSNGMMKISRQRKPVARISIFRHNTQGELMNPGDALAGQVALITGASRGIGLSIARRLGQMGARVSICARNHANLEK